LTIQRFNESLGEAIPVTRWFRSIGDYLAPDDAPPTVPAKN
jgi:hypothetical protein